MQERCQTRLIPRTDFHAHATRYRAEPHREVTVGAVVRQCEALGMDAVGVVEHFNDEPGHPLECFRRLVQDFRATTSPLSLFVGAELDILDDSGTVSGSAGVRQELGLDYCMAAVHSLEQEVHNNLDEYMGKRHALIMGAVEGCHFAEVIAHSWSIGGKVIASGLAKHWDFSRIPERYLEEFIQGLARTGKAMEVNRRDVEAENDPAYREFLQAARRAGVRVSVGSDAHDLESIARSLAISEFLERAGFSAGDIWTPRPLEREDAA